MTSNLDTLSNHYAKSNHHQQIQEAFALQSWLGRFEVYLIVSSKLIHPKQTLCKIDSTNTKGVCVTIIVRQILSLFDI